jgi:hypothetical protein
MPPLPLPARDWPVPPMDHGSGDKPSAFTWAMGRLILQRMGDRETMKAITADPAMPAYCTVFRWVKVIPEFGDAYRAVRLAISKAARQEAVARRAAIAEAHVAARIAAGKRVRHWVAGPRSTYTDEMARAIFVAISEGASMSEVVRTPGMPSFKAIYGWMKRRPDFEAMYVEACRQRAVGFEIDVEMIVDRAVPGDRLADLNRQIAAIEGRAGALTPKLHRPTPGVVEGGVREGFGEEARSDLRHWDT